MTCNICQRELTNDEISVNEDNRLYCMECLSFPFKQLNNNEHNYEVNPQYNLENLISTNSYNRSWLHKDHEIHTDLDIDPDTNYLLK